MRWALRWACHVNSLACINENHQKALYKALLQLMERRNLRSKSAPEKPPPPKRVFYPVTDFKRYIIDVDSPDDVDDDISQSSDKVMNTSQRIDFRLEENRIVTQDESEQQVGEPFDQFLLLPEKARRFCLMHIEKCQLFLMVNRVEIEQTREKMIQTLNNKGQKLQPFEKAILQLIVLLNRSNSGVKQRHILKKALKLLARRESVLKRWMQQQSTWTMFNCQEEHKKRKEQQRLMLIRREEVRKRAEQNYKIYKNKKKPTGQQPKRQIQELNTKKQEKEKPKRQEITELNQKQRLAKLYQEEKERNQRQETNTRIQKVQMSIHHNFQFEIDEQIEMQPQLEEFVQVQRKPQSVHLNEQIDRHHPFIKTEDLLKKLEEVEEKFREMRQLLQSLGIQHEIIQTQNAISKASIE